MIATDFDGTLSPIVDDPGAAALVDGAAAVLARLATQVAELAVVSGRPLSYLTSHLPEGLTMVGPVRPGVGASRRTSWTTPTRPSWRRVVDGVVRDAPGAGLAGLHVESKELSLTLHYRRHPELAPQVEALAEQLAAGSGLRVHAREDERRAAPADRRGQGHRADPPGRTTTTDR